MSVAMPTWDEFMTPMLRLLADGEIRSLRDLRDGLALGLTDEQRAERLPSGSPKSDNRIGWAASYLSRVGAVDRPTRGHYSITNLGRQLLTAHPEGLNERSLRTYARDDDQWWSASPNETAVAVDATAGLSLSGTAEVTVIDPIEQIETGVTRIHAAVAADLLDRLHAQAPAFFEQAVLDLLMAMGYGGAEGTATRTQLSNDGGIDGVIDQDALGLSRIYVQAKRYALDTAVGRPEIQAFVGALHGVQANQGVFITTGRFSSGARAYAEAVPTRVVMIDGRRLAILMIRYGVGVQVNQTIKLVEVDEDFFE